RRSSTNTASALKSRPDGGTLRWGSGRGAGRGGFQRLRRVGRERGGRRVIAGLEGAARLVGLGRQQGQDALRHLAHAVTLGEPADRDAGELLAGGVVDD